MCTIQITCIGSTWLFLILTCTHLLPQVQKHQLFFCIWSVTFKNLPPFVHVQLSAQNPLSIECGIILHGWSVRKQQLLQLPSRQQTLCLKPCTYKQGREESSRRTRRGLCFQDNHFYFYVTMTHCPQNISPINSQFFTNAHSLNIKVNGVSHISQKKEKEQPSEVKELAIQLPSQK